MVDGVVDYLKKKILKYLVLVNLHHNLKGLKGFMKNLCKEYNIPTAKFKVVKKKSDELNFINKNGVPIVVKADGLAAGKGVTICTSHK